MRVSGPGVQTVLSTYAWYLLLNNAAEVKARVSCEVGCFEQRKPSVGHLPSNEPDASENT